MRIFIIASALLLAACANDPQSGAVVGGAVGGATGAAVGYEMGGRDGAVLGGAIGAAAGAAIGSDASQPAQSGEASPPPVRRTRGHDEDKHREHRRGGHEHDDD